MPADGSYFSVLTEAVNDLVEHGFTDAERVARWQAELERAAKASLTDPKRLVSTLSGELRAVYRRLVEDAGALRVHPGVSSFTLQMIKPKLRAELDKRILASADLIRLNREESVARQLRRFSGWATSIPAGGAAEADRRKLKAEIRKPLARLPFEERRVAIDQGHRLAASIHQIIAQDGGAIACKWRHVHQSNYAARPEHLARDGKIYLIRDSWAHKAGLIAPDQNGYSDDIDQPSEKINCRCSWVFLYGLRRLPPGMLTSTGKQQLN